MLTPEGALSISTGDFTGRSPKDRFIVEDDCTRSEVDWGNINQPMSTEHFDLLHQDMASYLKDKSVFVRDAAVGSDPVTQIKTRVITEKAWANLFVSNMFVRLADQDVLVPDPEWHILCVPSFLASPERHGTRKENVSAINFSRKMILIAGSAYTGEIKKGMFLCDELRVADKAQSDADALLE